MIARSNEEIEFAYQQLDDSIEIGCDTETSGLNPRRGRLLSVQFSNGDFSVLVPISENVALGRLANLLENPKQIKIFHNAKFDLEFLRENGYLVTNVFDTMIAEKVLTYGADQSASLAETLYRYFAVNLDKTQRSIFTDRNWNGIWTPALLEYALSDVFFLPKLKQEQVIWLEKLNLKEKFEIQMKKFS